MNVGKVGSYFEDGKRLFLAKKEMAGEMFKLAPKSIQRLKKIGDKNGDENFNILVNAVGTAAVAPFFIAYNPLSKTDENTKKYSALRQPVSAILAVVTQCGLVIPWNRGIDYLTNNGKLGQHFSLEGFQDSKYLFRQLKKANPGKSKKEIDALVKAKQAEQYGRLYSEFLESGTITVGKSKLAEQDVLDILSETCDGIIKKNEDMLGRYKEGGEKYANKMRRAEFLFGNHKTVEERLTEIKKGLANCSDQDAVTKYMKNLVKKSKNDGVVSEMLKIFEEDLAPKGNKDAIIEQINHILKKSEEYQGLGDLNKVRETVIAAIRNQSEELGVQQTHFKQIKQMIQDKKPISAILDLIKKEKITFNSKDLELDNIRTGVIDKFIAKSSKRIKGLKAVTGLAVSLAIMPFTCCALNYLYPRFMDTFFPSLSKSKKEGGKK